VFAQQTLQPKLSRRR